MAFVRSKLKLARDALARKDWVAAFDASNSVLEYETDNYNANVFLGLASLELGKLDESSKAYRRAISLNPEQILAWQGLSKFYERTEDWKRHDETLNHLVEMYNKSEDAIKCAETWQKLVELRQEKGTTAELVEAMSLILPQGPLYQLLSTLPPPDPTEPLVTTIQKAQTAVHTSLNLLTEIVRLLSGSEVEYIQKEVQRRRTRIGARGPEAIQKEVGREVWGKSNLPSYLNEILNHPATPDYLRRSTEGDLLRYKERYLRSIANVPESLSQKAQLREEIDKMAEGIVFLHIPNDLGWKLYLESIDNDTVASYPISVIREFTQLFPASPLASVFRGYYAYLGQPIQRDPSAASQARTDQNSQGNLDTILDGYAMDPNNLLANRVLVELYLNEEDHENAEKVARHGLELLQKIYLDTGRLLTKVSKQFKAAQAISLVHMFSPKYHIQALEIIDEILAQEPDNIACLMGRGYIMQSSNQWHTAATLFNKVISLCKEDHPWSLRVEEEYAWCLCHIGQPIEGIDKLRRTHSRLNELHEHSQDIARCNWRIGAAYWETTDLRKEAAYGFFIASLKANPAFAPSFTSLGIYYAEFASPPDLNRASKCFQKAFELDARESEAARRLAEGFANDREWDLVEVIARRTIEGEGSQVGSVAAKYVPQNAWAWRALGAVEFHRKKYDSAIHAFQLTLRALPEDGNSWLRLGEAYNRAGRHTAAIKALERAHELRPDDWMPTYLVGEVKHRMGAYTEAIDALESVLYTRPSETGVLISLGQSYLDQGHVELAEGFRARGEASLANAVDIGLRALRESPGFRGVAWKIIGDSLFGLSTSTHYTIELRIRETLLSVSRLLPETLQIFPLSVSHLSTRIHQPCTAADGLRVAIAVYDYRSTLVAADASSCQSGSHWYDLGVCIQYWSTRFPEQAKSVSRGVIISLLTKALEEDTSNYLYWAALGDAYFLESPRVAQHAYLRSLELDPKAVSTWTKLGLLYIYHADAVLADEAFHRAQTLDPDSAGVWIGQALVALLNQQQDQATLMFEHAATLTANLPQGDLEFASRSVKRLTQLQRYDLKMQLDILLPAYHVMDRYIKNCPEDTTGLHLFALICEGLGHFELGAFTTSKAIVILEASYEDTEDPGIERRYIIANVTLGRLLTSLSRFKEACDVFDIAAGLLSGSEAAATRHSLRAQAELGLGLASYLSGDLPRALGTFESALETTSDDETIKGHLNVLLAKTMWAIGTDETTEGSKNLLLNCISADPENLPAINTLTGMGLLTGDDNLVDAALSEILSLTTQRRLELDPQREVDYLLMQFHLSQNEYTKSLLVGQKVLHSDAHNPVTRTTLGRLLLQGKNNRLAHAILFGNQGGGVDPQQLSASIRLETIATTDRRKERLRRAQWATKLAPWVIQNWQTLAYIVSL